jgi:hypothetical protein
MKDVTEKGLYALYPGNAVAPLDAIYLNPGDKYGFVTRQGQVLGAYSKGGKTSTIALDSILSSDYLWRLEKEKK